MHPTATDVHDRSTHPVTTRTRQIQASMSDRLGTTNTEKEPVGERCQLPEVDRPTSPRGARCNGIDQDDERVHLNRQADRDADQPGLGGARKNHIPGGVDDLACILRKPRLAQRRDLSTLDEDVQFAGLIRCGNDSQLVSVRIVSSHSSDGKPR